MADKEQGAPVEKLRASGQPGAPGPAGPVRTESPTAGNPVTPCEVAGMHPGDARHSILEVRRSSGRSSGSRNGVQLPTSSSISPLAGKAPNRHEGPKRAAAGGGSREGQGDDEEAPGSEPTFAGTKRRLFRASDLLPSSPAGPSRVSAPAPEAAIPRSGAPEVNSPRGGLSASAAEAVAAADAGEMSGAVDGSGDEPGVGGGVCVGTKRAASWPGLGRGDNEGGRVGPRDSGVVVGGERESDAAPERARSEPAPEHPNKRSRVDEPAAAPVGPPPSPLPPAPPSIGSSAVLFPTIPLVFDGGAATGRIWCPTGYGGEGDPHWKEWPRNWDHPETPGEGTVPPHLLLQPDTSLPATIHAHLDDHARNGTLFASTMHHLTLASDLVANCGYDFDKDPLTHEIPNWDAIQERAANAVFSFPRTGANPFLGWRLLGFYEKPGWMKSMLSESKEKNPIGEGVGVPDAMPMTIRDGAEFKRRQDGAVVVPREWWNEVMGDGVSIMMKGPKAGRKEGEGSGNGDRNGSKEREKANGGGAVAREMESSDNNNKGGEQQLDSESQTTAAPEAAAAQPGTTPMDVDKTTDTEASTTPAISQSKEETNLDTAPSPSSCWPFAQNIPLPKGPSSSTINLVTGLPHSHSRTTTTGTGTSTSAPVTTDSNDLSSGL